MSRFRIAAPICRGFARRSGDEGTLADSKPSCGLYLTDALESWPQIENAFGTGRSRHNQFEGERPCEFSLSGPPAP